MVTTRRAARTRPPVRRSDGSESYVACGTCHRCVTDKGRDAVLGASDCWGAYLDAIAQALSMASA